jgi:hypothetical protein
MALVDKHKARHPLGLQLVKNWICRSCHMAMIKKAEHVGMDLDAALDTLMEKHNTF